MAVRGPGRLLVLAVLVTGCSEEAHPDLTPEVIESLGKAEGTARGGEWSGLYPVQLEREGCSCSAHAGATEDAYCDDLDLSAWPSFSADVVQTDGRVVIDTENGWLVGPVNADGSVVAAGWIVYDSAHGNLDVIARLDGSFDTVPDGARLSGTFRERLLGSKGRDEVDCLATFDMIATRYD